MSNPNHIRVQAFIPHENEDKYVLDQDDDKPTVIFDPTKHVTFEGAVHDIMQNVAGTYGKVQRRLTEHEQDPNHIVYRTQSLGSSALLGNNHRWGA